MLGAGKGESRTLSGLSPFNSSILPGGTVERGMYLCILACCHTRARNGRVNGFVTTAVTTPKLSNANSESFCKGRL